MLYIDEIDRHKNGIYVLDEELDAMVPQHRHCQGHILVVQNGVATVNVEHSEYYIPYGYFVWIPPEKYHRISFEEKKIRLINIYYPASCAEPEFYRSVGVYPMPSVLYHAIELIRNNTIEYRPDDWQYELLSTVIHILPHIVPEQVFKLRLPTSNHTVTRRIVRLIQREYRHNLTAQYVASECGLSVRTLSRYLRSELDITFVQYVRTYRILMAIKQLIRTQDTVASVAESVGYDSLTAFSNAFYKVTSTRPSQFRSQF